MGMAGFKKRGAAVMSPVISIITPTLGHAQKLAPLFKSLKRQSSAPSFELLLCATSAPDALKQSLPDLGENLIKIIESPEKCISAARNRGLEEAKGDLLFFLDDDCHLPDELYLHDLYEAYKMSNGFSGGGFYINERSNKNIFSRFYNLLCNVWLYAHFNSHKKPLVLLGGCCFYSKKILWDNHLRFESLNKRAGEEYALNRNVVAQGYDLFLQDRWNVYHNPNCRLRDVFRKAWVQGKSMDQKKNAPSFLRPLFRVLWKKPARLAYLPLFAIYYAVGRAAYWKNGFEKSKNHPQAIGHMGGRKIKPEPQSEFPAINS